MCVCEMKMAIIPEWLLPHKTLELKQNGVVLIFVQRPNARTLDCKFLATSSPGIFSMKVLLTDCRASWGQGWNQLIAVQFTRAGNFRARVRSVNPTGEKHRTTWRSIF